MSLWIFPSIGNSPRRKWRAAMLDDLLRLSMPLRVFLWNIDREYRFVVLSEKEDKPDLRIGQEYVLNKLIFTTGLRRHFQDKERPTLFYPKVHVFLLLGDPTHNLTKMFIVFCHLNWLIVQSPGSHVFVIIHVDFRTNNSYFGFGGTICNHVHFTVK